MECKSINRNVLISVKDLGKTYFGISVLKDVCFDLHESEVMGLVGENGAGKSTLIKILSGAISPSQGTIITGGKEYSELTPSEAGEAGIHAIYQETILVPSMNVMENIFIGNENVGKFGVINKKENLRKTKELIATLDIEIDPYVKIRDLNVADQQYVKILKALAQNSKVLIMDEPTTMFNEKDIEKVMRTIKRIKKQGIAVIYISHHLEEIREIAENILVLRDGKMINIHDNAAHNIDFLTLVSDMVGRSIEQFYHKENIKIGEELFKVEKLIYSKNKEPISFSVKRGEILGVSGMVGSGRTELMQAIFGVDKKKSGKLFFEGKEIIINNPNDAINNGIAFITEDRQRYGLNLNMDIIDNMVMIDVDIRNIKWYKKKDLQNSMFPLFNQLRVKAPSPYTQVKNLSGGNQQKVVLGKWLMMNSKVIIFDEPTRGIDVNAKSEIFDIISSLSKEGKAIIMVSSDMPELIAMSDRIIVMRENSIIADISKEDMDEENILSKSIGV